MNLKNKTVLFFATGFGLGRIPVAPGTFGTLAGIPLAVGLAFTAPGLQVTAMVCLILFAIFIADKAEKIMGKKDPGSVVIDEMAGFAVAVSGIPISIPVLAAGFFIFRFFDIVKPQPVKFFEDSFSGGAGIVLDDLAAGLMSWCVLRLIF